MFSFCLMLTIVSTIFSCWGETVLKMKFSKFKQTLYNERGLGVFVRESGKLSTTFVWKFMSKMYLFL